jgi:hypothetical protein
VVIGHDHFDAELSRRLDALDARDAVVHRYEQVGLGFRRERHDLRREPVAELKSIGHEIADVRTECGERTHAERAGGGAVAIVVGDDQHALARRNRIGEQHRSALRVQQVGGRNQPG